MSSTICVCDCPYLEDNEPCSNCAKDEYESCLWCTSCICDCIHPEVA